MTQQDPFVTRCLAQLTTSEDPREWNSDSAFKPALDMVNRGSSYANMAVVECEKLIARFPDLDLGYDWAATALLEKGDLAKAKQLLDAGIARCRRKYNLWSLRGDLAMKERNAKDAVYWWSQAARAGGKLLYKRTYLCLQAAASAVGESAAASRFADMEGRRTQLNSSEQNDIRAMMAAERTPAMAEVLRKAAGA